MSLGSEIDDWLPPWNESDGSARLEPRANAFLEVGNEMAGKGLSVSTTIIAAVLIIEGTCILEKPMECSS
jgi:hypothetical protein